MRAGPDRHRRGWQPRPCMAQNAPVDKTDWSPLAGKPVLVWPDRDAPGWDYADRASQTILNAGATTVAILVPPDDKPEGWDAADAIGTHLRHSRRRRADASDALVGRRHHRICDRCRLGYGGRLVSAFTRRYGGLALLRGFGKWLVLDGVRWNPIRSLCISPGARYLPDGVTQTPTALSSKANWPARHDLVRRENRWRSDPKHASPPRVGCRRLGAQHPGGVVDLRTGRVRAAPAR